MRYDEQQKSSDKRGRRRTVSPFASAGFFIAVAALWLFASGEVDPDLKIALTVSALLGLITAAIAKSKGRSFLPWWIYGTALFVVALPHALLMKPDAQAIEREKLASGDSRKCPFCAEIVKREAVVCRYCGRDLPPITSAQ
jgi:hypothetical protein